MEAIQVTCPKCGAVLQVTNTTGEEYKVFKCPKCGATLKVKFPAPCSSNEEGGTLYGTSGFKAPADEEKTQVNTDSIGKMPVLVCNDKTYELEIGRNVIGRKASTSTADVQIETDDRYMSRQHAVINVVRLMNGGIRAIISNASNKNVTYVGDAALEGSDELVLTHGIEIRMGHTYFKYVVEN